MIVIMRIQITCAKHVVFWSESLSVTRWSFLSVAFYTLVIVGHGFSTLAHWYKETRSLSWRAILIVVGHKVFLCRWNTFCWGWCSRVSWKEAFLREWWITVTLQPHKAHAHLSWRAIEGKMGLFWSRVWGYSSSWQGRQRSDSGLWR